MDKNLENIINRVANRNSTSPAKAKLAFETFFRNAKHLLQRDDMPTVMMHGLGKIEPNERKLKGRLVTIKKRLLRKAITQEVFEHEKKRILGILEVLKSNKHYRNN